VFSSARSAHGGEGLANVIPKAPVRLHIPVELDLPEHRSYRKILNPLTAPTAVARLQPMIKRWTTWFIDEVIETGSCDFATVIGVPAVVTLDWLGLDVAEWRRYTRALHAVLADSPGSPAHTQAIEVDIPCMEARITEAIALRRVEPRDDLISCLLAQRVDGVPISDGAAYSMVELLISGGVGTTASLVGQTLVHLSRYPEQRRELIADPDLLPRAVEEFLRAFSPTQALARTVSQDTEFRGCPMRQGDRVLLAWSSANRDPAQFERPDEVVLSRWPNRHTAFGIGIHRCAGAHLARAIAGELLGQILERMPDYAVDETALVHYAHQGVNAGYRQIPATFTPGPRWSRRNSGGLAADRS
jgi:cytochrome P450